MADPSPALVELRVLEGPNAFYPRPAVKLVLEVGHLVSAGSVASGAPGAAGSLQRRRWAARQLAALVRAIAASAGTARLAVRARPAQDPARVIVAFPWRQRGRAVALAEAVVRVVATEPDPARWRQVAEREGAVVAAAEPGSPALVQRPRVPAVAVTGTNGKTTVTRLIAHIGRTAGRSVAWTSTDGVYVDGVELERGDWSGPGGAQLALAAPGVQLAVLETARGGILLRGMAVTGVAVGVVTNVAADHLGLSDIHTIDELAEVKAVVARAVRPGGVVVLNGDDPRVLAMHAVSKGTPYVFSMDSGSPSLRLALERGGRGITVADGALCLVEPGESLDRVVEVLDVPVALAGLSPHNTANALAALGAATALGLPRAAIEAGLRSFEPDHQLNPGRMNIWSLDDVLVVVDLAHNEDGLGALLRVAGGLRRGAAQVRLVMGTAGDRTDDVLRGLGHLAQHGADDVVVADKSHYLRDRDPGQMHALLSEGTGRALERYPDELAALRELLTRARAGDVVAVMCHEQLAEIGGMLEAAGARAVRPRELRDRVT